jgi:hypothetical protein
MDALNVYLSYSLKAALEWQATERIFQSTTTITERDGYLKLLDELIKYLQQSLSSKSSSASQLLGPLAVIDRLEEAVISARADALHFGSADLWNLYHHSALYLRHSLVVESKGDQELAEEWLLASQLCDAATRLWWAGNSTAQQLSHKEITGWEVISRANVCIAIVQLLDVFPELIAEGVHSVIARYRFKRAVAECLYRRRQASTSSTSKWFSSETDTRLRSLNERLHRLCAVTMAELRAMYTSGNTWSPEYKAMSSALTVMNRLCEPVALLLTTLTECGNAIPREAQSTDAAFRYAALVAEKELLLDSFASASMYQSATIRERAQEAQRLCDSAKTLQRAINGNAQVESGNLAQICRSRALQAASSGPHSAYQQKITECWEKAAALAAAEDFAAADTNPACQYAKLAEGVFASAVTCHTQWERAVQRRDDKLVDFWQRARERAWAVGCEACEQLQLTGFTKMACHRIVKAVRLVQEVQHLAQKQPPAPLAELEVDLTILTADVYLAFDDDQEAQVPAKTIRKALARVRAINQQEQLALAEENDVEVCDWTRESLTWAAQTLRAMFDLSHRCMQGEETSWVAQTDQWYESVLHIINVLDSMGEVESLSLGMFIVDLHVQYLQASFEDDNAVDTLVTYALMDINRRLHKAMFRNQTCSNLGDVLNAVTFVQERAFREAYPEDRLLRLEQQWPAQRRRWLPTEPPSPADAAIVEKIVAAKNRDLHWQLMAAKCADSALRFRYKKTATSFWNQWDRLLILARFVFAREVEMDSKVSIRSTQGVLVAAGEVQTQADELACAALQQGNKDAVELCASTVYVVRPLLDGCNLFSDVCLAQKAVETILACADCHIRAANALLGGTRDVADKWRTAAQLYEDAVDIAPKMGMSVDQRLRSGWEEALHRAEVLADQARRAEEAAAAAAVVAVAV